MSYLIQGMPLPLLNLRTGTMERFITDMHMCLYQVSSRSNFTENDGGSGGAVSMTYFPSNFDGINVFLRNRGRSLVVGNEVYIVTMGVETEMFVCRLLVPLLRYMDKCILSRMAM